MDSEENGVTLLEDEDPHHPPKLPIPDEHAFGSKNITFFGSVVLLVNNIMGPAMVTIPLVYHLGGFLSTTLILVLTFIVSSFSATMLCEAMQRIPGNHNFALRYEFATTMGHYFGKKAEILGQFLVNGCLMASAMASIIVAAQVMDDFLVFAFGHTYGVHFVPEYAWISVNISSEAYFDAEPNVLSLGYLVCAIICIPFGYFNLDDNMYFQWFSFALLIGTVFEFIIAFFCMPLNFELAPVLGRGLNGQVLVLGVISFSWAYIITVPSWINEKQDKVSVNKTVWISTSIGLFLKFSFGFLAAIAFTNKGDSANILNGGSTLNGAFRTITSICVYFYSIGTIVPGIPVYSILIRYNLVSGKILRPFFANLIAVVFPWVFSCFFYHGPTFRFNIPSLFVNWSSLLLQGFVNFVIPCALYYRSLVLYPTLPLSQRESKLFVNEVKRASFGSERTIEVQCTHPASLECSEVANIEAVKSWMLVNPKFLAILFIVFFTFISLFTIVMNAVYGIIGLVNNGTTPNITSLDSF